MKTTSALILLIALATTTATLAPLSAFAQAEAPSIVPTAFHSIYAPAGFDSNDHVQMVGEGLFRSSCYRPADVSVAVDHAKRVISVGATAYEYGGICLQVMLPFDRVLEVGLLKPGTYDIQQAGDGSKLGTISVKPSFTDAPDDYLYAPVSQAFFRAKQGKNAVYLTGEFSNSCMKLSEVRVNIEPKVIVLQPIATLETRPDCNNGKYPFEKVVDIDSVPTGRYLLHVRSMNAKAINTLVDVK